MVTLTISDDTGDEGLYFTLTSDQAELSLRVSYDEMPELTDFCEERRHIQAALRDEAVDDEGAET